MNRYFWLMIAAVMLILSCGGNNAPIISNVTADPSSTYPGETTTLTCTADDEDGDAITYRWSAEAGNLSATNSSSVVWTAPNDTGTYAMEVMVEDEGGLADTGSIDVRVNPNWTYGENMTSVPIYDFTWTYSEINISGAPTGSEVDSVAIAVTITHTYPADLDIYLVAPDGTQLLIWDNTFPGGTEMVKTDFFAGKEVNGTWTLWIYDEYLGDEGTLDGWNMVILWKF